MDVFPRRLLAAISIQSEILQMTSETDINIRAIPAFLQDRRELRTATGTSGNPNAGRGADLAVFLGIETHSSRVLLLNA
jgi:hypothetical protein